MNKQVEEMAQVYEEARYKAQETLGSMNEGAGVWYAKAFYNAGYRRQDEVAREIFAEIDNILCSLDKRHMMCGNPKQSWGVRSAMAEIAALKKKYEVQE